MRHPVSYEPGARLKLFGGLILWAACAVGQTVEGTVINSATGIGVANVTVEIVKAGEPAFNPFGGAAMYSATTDSQGRFRVEHVQDGAYTARYWSTVGSFIDESIAPGRAGEPRPPFQVTAGGNSVKLEGRLIAMARMRGRVIDDKGKAVPKAEIELSQSGRLMRRSPADANGKFDLPVFPGAYTLAVVPPTGWKPPDPEPDGNRALRWVRVYYPGVASPEAASKIVLGSGGDFSGIEMKLLAVPGHAVRGVIVRPDGAPAPNVAISLEETSTAFLVESNADGSFEFPAVADGAFRFSAAAESDGETLRAGQWMEMAGRDLEGVKVRLSAPFTVSGRVIMETPKGLPAVQPPSVRLSPVSRSRNVDPPVFASPDADGNFSLEHVYPGAYRVGGLEPPPSYYLDTVRLGEADIAAPEVELFSGAVPVTLVYKTNGGTVRGTVEQCASGGVVLVPQDPGMRWAEFVRTGRCDSKDRYEITAMRPGEYFAQAFPSDPFSPFWTPKFDESLVNRASRITVRAGENSPADLRAITSPY